MTTELDLTCDICLKKYSTASYLKKHKLMCLKKSNIDKSSMVAVSSVTSETSKTSVTSVTSETRVSLDTREVIEISDESYMSIESLKNQISVLKQEKKSLEDELKYVNKCCEERMKNLSTRNRELDTKIVELTEENREAGQALMEVIRQDREMERPIIHEVTVNNNTIVIRNKSMLKLCIQHNLLHQSVHRLLDYENEIIDNDWDENEENETRKN